jgi:D-amino-acid dehydrogenase
MTLEVVVIGGGVIGAVAALRLAEAGFRTLLLDEGRAVKPASWGNAGHIAIEQPVPWASPAALRSAPGRLFLRGGALDFRLRDISAWLPWAIRHIRAASAAQAAAGTAALGLLLARAVPAWRRLVTDLGDPRLLAEDGHWLVWEHRGAAVAGRKAWADANIGTAAIGDLSEAAIAALRVCDGIEFRHTGQIRDLPKLHFFLRERLERLGGERRTATVRRLINVGDRVRIELSDGEILAPEKVVVAAGVGSGALLRRLGHEAPVVAERGYHIEGGIGGWPELPPVVFEERSMIVTRFGDRLRAASFVEFAREKAPPDERKWARLTQHVRELGIPMAEPIACWMGARPTLPDYLPAIGRSGIFPSLFYAFGHQHLGLTLAAVTGEILADLVQGRDPGLSLLPFDLARFGERRERQMVETGS